MSWIETVINNATAAENKLVCDCQMSGCEAGSICKTLSVESCHIMQCILMVSWNLEKLAKFGHLSEFFQHISWAKFLTKFLKTLPNYVKIYQLMQGIVCLLPFIIIFTVFFGIICSK
jgi:hypothetical protein